MNDTIQETIASLHDMIRRRDIQIERQAVHVWTLKQEIGELEKEIEKLRLSVRSNQNGL